MPVAKTAKTAKVQSNDKSEPFSWWYGAAFLAVTSVFGLAAWMVADGQVAGWEQTGLRAVNDWPEAWRTFFLVASLAPSSLWIGLASVAIAFGLRLHHLTWRLSVSVLAGAFVTEAAKHWIARSRPGELISDLHVRVAHDGFGFPSGHTLMMTVVALTVLPYLPRWLKWLALLLVVLMALSRLYLGVHAPLDVIGGAALGAAIVLAIEALPKRWKRVARFD